MSTLAKPLPGPYTVEATEDGGARVRHDATGTSIAWCNCAFGGIVSIYPKTAAAHARLFAAAPDLLATLKSARYSVNIARACLLDSVSTHDTWGGWLHEEATRLSSVIDEIDSAIAKATGDEREPDR